MQPVCRRVVFNNRLGAQGGSNSFSRPMTEHPHSYYRKRFDYLIFPSIFINAYYSLFLFFVYYYNLVARLDSNGQPLTSPIGYKPVIFQAVLLAITFFVGWIGMRSPRLWSLVICTGLFILTISLPVYYWGGSNRSIFSPILATVSGLTVIFTVSKWTRGGFAVVCVALFILCAVWKVDIVPTDNLIIKYSSHQVYAIFQTSSAVVSIIVALFLGWQSKPIFGEEKQT
jgi:hypothetical protein